MTQSLIQHQSCHFCSLARLAHECSRLINCLSPTHARPGSRTHVRVQGRTSGFKDAHPGSRTHIRVQGRNLCRFKHAHPGFHAIKKLLSGQRSFYSPFNARKRREKHKLLARSWAVTSFESIAVRHSKPKPSATII